MAAASIFSAAVPLMAADTTDYVLKVSNRSGLNDGVKLSLDFSCDTSWLVLCFDARSDIDGEMFVSFNGLNYTYFYPNGDDTVKKVGNAWNTYKVFWDCTGLTFDKLDICIFNWANSSSFYLDNIYLFDINSGITPGESLNLLTGTTEPLDFLDTSCTFSPISRDTSKESDCVLSYVNSNEIVTIGDYTGYVLYTTYTGFDDNSNAITSEEFTVATSGSVISKIQDTSPPYAGNLYWCNSVQLDISKYCTYRVTFTLKGHVTKHYSEDYVLPNGIGSMTFTDALPTKWNELGAMFNASGENYLTHTTANYYQTVTMAFDGVNTDNKEDTFIFEYIFSTADGYIDNVDPGTYFVNFLNLDSDNWSEYNISFVGVSVDAVVDPQSEYYEKLIIQDLEERANELGMIGAQSSKAENWALDKAEDIRKEAKAGMSENLDIAKSFISGSTFSARGGGIQAAATAFGTIYNSVVSAVPGELQALIIIIPTLAFIGWVIGRVQ